MGLKSHIYNPSMSQLWSFIGCPAQVSPAVDLRQAFAEASMVDTWVDARLPQAIRYVRGSKHLHIPPEWRNYLPTTGWCVFLLLAVLELPRGKA